MKSRIALVLAAALCATAVAGEAGFSVKPSATRTGDSVRIAFTVSAPIDVEVAILDAKGAAVRHLAAGALGGEKPPPAPLKAGLAQDLEWDGKDDAGKAVPAAGVKVRVRLGLGVKLAGSGFGSELRPDYLASVEGLAAAPDGRVYVLSQRWKKGWWDLSSIHVFTRDGKYEKTVKPYPTSLPAERLGALTRLGYPDGRPLPTIHRVISMSLYPREDFPQQMTVDREGRLHFITVPAECGKIVGPGRWLASLAPDGGLAYAEYAPAEPTSRGSLGQVYLAASPDGKWVCATGVTVLKDAAGKRTNAPVVVRIPLPSRDKLEPLFGDPAAPGNDQAHLSDPRGLAIDSEGRLLVADFGNNRVVLLDGGTGRFAGSFPVRSPTWVGAGGKDGAVYVAGAAGVVKFVLDDAGKAVEKARLQLADPPGAKPGSIRRSFALDASTRPAVLWIGQDRAEPFLSRCVEKADGTFGDTEPAGCQPARHYWNLDAGLDGRNVSCKIGNYTLRILDEESGQTREIAVPKAQGSAGQTYRLGPGGQIYGIDHWKWGVRRWDRDGKPLPFPATMNLPEAEARGRLPNAPSGTTSWERDFDVDREGNVYVKHRGPTYHGRKRVDKYDKDGNFLGTLIWVVSDGALGPKVGPGGSLYIAENVKPVGEPFPAMFRGKLPQMKIERGTVETQYAWMYGSIIKFGPAGGAVWFPKTADRDVYAFEGEARLPAGLPRTKAETVYGEKGKVLPLEIEGAEWFRPGCSYVLDMHPATSWRCHCTSTDFDVDPWGRCFYTDQGLFCVIALDGAGNEITRFGRYGNQDAVGPEIAFQLFTGLAVSERSVFVADGGHRRVIRLEKTFAAKEIVDVK